MTDNFSILDSGVIDVPHDISDHKATFIVIPFADISTSVATRKIWFYKRGDYIKMNNLIQEFNWNVLTTCSIEDACRHFTDTITYFMHQCIPSKEVIIGSKEKLWYDSKIRPYSRKRDRLKVIAVGSKRIEDWAKYKKLRNKVNNLKTHYKEQYFNNI